MTVPPDFEPFITAHANGDVLSGRVVSVVPFGVFVEVAAGIHGLLHGGDQTEGTEVQVKILDVDPANRRLSLALA